MAFTLSYISIGLSVLSIVCAALSTYYSWRVRALTTME